MAEFRLETERLILREGRKDERPLFQALFNTPEMTRHMGGVARAAEFNRLFDKRLSDQTQDGLSYWAVELREEGIVVGSCGLRRARNYPGTPVQDMVEAGWRIAAPWWRKGLAEEAMRTALAWGWRTLADPVIGGWTTVQNMPSLALMRKLGFVRARQLDFDRPVSGERCLVHLFQRPESTNL